MARLPTLLGATFLFLASSLAHPIVSLEGEERYVRTFSQDNWCQIEPVEGDCSLGNPLPDSVTLSGPGSVAGGNGVGSGTAQQTALEFNGNRLAVGGSTDVDWFVSPGTSGTSWSRTDMVLQIDEFHAYSLSGQLFARCVGDCDRPQDGHAAGQFSFSKRAFGGNNSVVFAVNAITAAVPQGSSSIVSSSLNDVGILNPGTYDVLGLSAGFVNSPGTSADASFSYELILVTLDEDIDGISVDGDGSLIPGDNPCTGGAATGCDDNCPSIANPGQEDSNSNGAGDACEPPTVPALSHAGVILLLSLMSVGLADVWFRRRNS